MPKRKAAGGVCIGSKTIMGMGGYGKNMMQFSKWADQALEHTSEPVSYRQVVSVLCNYLIPKGDCGNLNNTKNE